MALFDFFKKKSESKKAQINNGYSSVHDNTATNVHCPNDEHNFIEADVYTGGTLYRCDKCGLEVNAPIFPRMIFKEYFGSYINGISHQWISSDMQAEDIVNFAISFGNLPIVTVKYGNSVMKVKNSINGSRDGWMSFPDGYFDERIIKISDDEKRKLYECLKSLDFSSFTTSPDLFRNFGAPGFCISHRFLCRFSNGKGFECLSPHCNDFNVLVDVVRSIIGMNSKTVCAETVYNNALYNNQETGWLCDCGAGNKISYEFCEICGKKRPW